MLDENKFNFEIENLKKDFAMENINITLDDINMLRKYNNNEISMNDVINNITKKSLIKDDK